MRTRSRSAPAARTVSVDGDATRHDVRRGAVQREGPVRRVRVEPDEHDQDAEQHHAQRDGNEQRDHRDCHERERGARGRAHRGIGTMPIAVRTASSAV